MKYTNTFLIVVERLEGPDDSISSDEEEANAARCSDILETTAPADTDQVCVSQKDEGTNINYSKTFE